MSKRKIDITITKAATFNTGNFCSIKPEISITLKDVPSDEIEAEHRKLDNLADALFAMNVIGLLDESETYNQIGMKRYLETLKENEVEMITIVERYSNE